MSLKTALSIRYISDVAAKSARDARAIQRMEKMTVRSFRRISAQARKTLTSVASLGKTAAGIGAAGGVAMATQQTLSASQSIINFQAGAGLSEKQTQRFNKLAPELSRKFTIFENDIVGIATAIQGLIGDFDKTLAVLPAALDLAKVAGLENSPDQISKLVFAASKAGAKTTRDFLRYFSELLVSGFAGSFILPEQAQSIGTLTAASQAYTAGQRGLGTKEFQPTLQTVRGSFKSGDEMATAFNALALAVNSLPGLKKLATDLDGNRIDFNEFISKISKKFEGRESEIFNVEGLSQNAAQFLFAAIKNIDQAREISRAVSSAIPEEITMAREQVQTGIMDRLGGAGIDGVYFFGKLADVLTKGADAAALAREEEQNRDDTRMQATEININLKNAPAGTWIKSTETTGPGRTRTTISPASLGTHDELPD